MTLSPRTIARSIFRWDWLSCVSSALRRTRFMCGSNPSRIPRYPRPPFNSTMTFELMRWLRRERGLIIEASSSERGALLKGLWGRRSARPIVRSVALRRVDEEPRGPEHVHADDHVVAHVLAVRHGGRDVESSARDHDPCGHDVALFGFVRGGGTDLDVVPDGTQTR